MNTEPTKRQKSSMQNIIPTSIQATDSTIHRNISGARSTPPI